MSENITYTSKQICEFYADNRIKLCDFYDSERWVFERIAKETKTMGSVLDVGCACGGLGLALSEKYKLHSYTGIDINRDAISWANANVKIPIQTEFIAGDIVRLELDRQFDTVFSLSCADWNIETTAIINSCWNRVKQGGYFVISLRLTTEDGINDISKSYQYINFSGNDKRPEVANYVVFNFYDALSMFRSITPLPELIGAYCYRGRPSITAVTPYKRLLFTVFYIKKGFEITNYDTKSELFLPAGIYNHTPSKK